MFFNSHFHTAVELLREYRGEEPFHLYLKKYFRAHPKHGSRDRKRIGQFCYAALRMGKSARHLSKEQQIAAGYFLCSLSSNPELEFLHPDWNQLAGIPWLQKWTLLESLQIKIAEVFPWKDQYSQGIDDVAFTASFFQQPLVFARVRPGQKEAVEAKLRSIAHEWSGNDTVVVESNIRLQDYLQINSEIVIQDRSSQRVGHWIKQADLPSSARVWDCCAASGGKTILLADLIPTAQITVSDIRASILKNLRQRLQEADVAVVQQLVTDLSQPTSIMPDGPFDLVLADVPCSGSGTWARTPEQLYFFDSASISKYARLQEKIVTQAGTRVKRGGYLLYCTCSVFKEENETQVNRLLETGNWQLIGQQLITGYDQRADTLFAGLLRKI